MLFRSREITLKGTSDRIPTLDELLALVDGRVGLCLELKSDFPRRPDERLVARVAEKLAAEPEEERDGAKRILVTSIACDGAPGAVELARALSKIGRAVLIETNVEPGVGGRGPLGISDLVGGRAGFDEVIHSDRLSALHLVPAGRGRAILAEGFDVAIEAFARTYDYVVLLAAPADDHAIRHLVLHAVDGGLARGDDKRHLLRQAAGGGLDQQAFQIAAPVAGVDELRA